MLFVIIKFLLVTMEVVSALLLIGVVLIQKSKSQGAGLAFGSGMGETLFGGQISNVLTKITVIIAVVFLLNTVFLTLLTTREARRGNLVPVPVHTGEGHPPAQHHADGMPVSPDTTLPDSSGGMLPVLPVTGGSGVMPDAAPAAAE